MNSKRYWQNQLRESPAMLTLPTDTQRQSRSGEKTAVSATITTQLTPPSAALANAHHLLAAYALLLLRHSRQDEIVIGVPIDNQLLPLRLRLSKGGLFTDLVSQLHQVYDQATANSLPLTDIVSAVAPALDDSYAPLFQAVFTDSTLPENTAVYDLTLAIDNTTCHWHYRADLFTAEQIEQMAARYAVLLQSIDDQPQTAVSRLPILPEQERHQLLHQWQGKPDNSIPQICLHEQVEAWAKHQPNKTAVSDEHTTMTYGELNGRANQLARQLIQHGVQPGDPVGIHMPASVPAIIAIIACHKARTAYVPFDPAYPTQRLQLMLDDTAAPVVLTESTLNHLTTGRCTILPWNTIQPALNEQPDDNLALNYTPTDPAYIIYTSGSTGKPKGVICAHTGIFNLSRSFDQWGNLPKNPISSLWTSLNFDASVYEIFPAFINGGSLHIVPQAIRADATRLFEWLAQNKIQNSYIPPFMVESFCQWLQESDSHLSHLHRLMVGVEPLAEPMLVEIKRHVPTLTLINAYGPTEASVCSAIYHVPSDSTRTGNAPIGKPLLNFELYVLDEQLQPVPIGVPGELFVGGIGLAHGYLNRPKLTAERFVANPFSDDENGRLYRTGDLVRYLPDGNLMFVGRSDFQLKVRGFRIELGEIETHLLAQEGVKTAVVMPHTASDGQITLVAYYVTDDKPNAPDQQTLRQALTEALPRYMVPAIWIQLDKMPRTPNDKINRHALPEPNLDNIVRDVPFTAPRNDVETQLSDLWLTHFAIEQVSVHDAFLDLGGHSLLATRFTSHIQQVFGVRLPVSYLFDHGTIAEIAAFISENETAGSSATIQPTTNPAKLPLSLTQQRLWFFYKLNPQSATYNEPIALRLRGDINAEWLQASLTAVTTRHHVLRTIFYEDDGDVYGRVQPITSLPLPLTDLQQLSTDDQEAAVRQRMQEERERPFTLTSDIPIRTQLLQLAPDHTVLLLTLHHIAIDLWSIDLFVDEIRAFYSAHQTHSTADLPPLPIQFSDYAAWQQTWLATHEETQLAYWENTLTANPDPLALPLDKPRPDQPSDDGISYFFQLPDRLYQPIHRFFQDEKVSLFMGLLAAYQALLHQYTHQNDINVGIPLANRHHTHTENLIGFFANTAVINATITPSTTFRQLLHQTRLRTLGAQDHQDVPFNKVVERLQTDRDGNTAPLIQTFFTVQAIENKPNIPGVTLALIQSTDQAVKFDLTLTLSDQNRQISGYLDYRKAIFSSARIVQLSQHYVTLLDALLQNPDTPLSQLDIRTDAERTQQTPTPHTDTNIMLMEQFNQVAATFGDKTAVSTPTATLTYSQLHQQSNQIAHLLQQHNCQPGDVVAIQASDTPEMITAVFGTLKAGCYYLPLNPDEPASWQQHAMQQSHAKWVLQPQDTATLNVPECQTIAISAAQTHPTTEPPITQAGGIYLYPFGAYPTAELAQLAAVYSLPNSSQVLQFAPFASHPATHDIFATLLNGGTLHLAPRAELTKLSSLYKLLTQKQIDFAILPAVLLNALDPKRVPLLKTAVSLEADMSATIWQKWAGRNRQHGHLSSATILPTILADVEEGAEWLTGTPRLPITIQTPSGKPAPTGVIGDLLINEQRTGDQWRWLENGRIQFRHYHPTHTSTRGQYIQTAALAQQLAAHPSIDQCVILPDSAPSEKRQLTAYVVTNQPLDNDQLAQFAQQRLPKQFVPATVHIIEQMPTTEDGAVDYEALTAVQQAATKSGEKSDARATKQALLDARKQNLSAKKKALLEKWKTQTATKKDDPAKPAPKATRPSTNKTEQIPVSFAQQRLLIIDQLDPNQSTYNIPLAFKFDGVLNLEALQTAVNQLFMRHDALRTTFYYDSEGQPYQKVSADTALPISHIDLTSSTAPPSETEVKAFIQAEIERPFSLTTDTLIRVTRIHVADQTHVLVFVLHHIITDGWSMEIFVRELLYLYTTHLKNIPSQLPPMPIQYADFAIWQREWLQGDVLAKQLRYWETQLKDAPSVVTLQADFPRPKLQSTRGADYTAVLSHRLQQSLNDLSQAQNGSLFMTLFAAYTLLLARHSQQDDIIIGTPIANRNESASENLIGFFVNMLPFRTKIEPADTFLTLLAKVHETALDGYSNQDVPFEKLVDTLHPLRETSHSPIFQVAFTLQNQPKKLPSLDGATLTPLESETPTAKYDLTLTVTETVNGLICDWEYSTDLFLPETIERLHTHFDALLRAIVQQPETAVYELPILPAHERQLLLHDWQGKLDHTIPAICLHQAIESWAEAAPNTTAVSDEHTTMSYGELNGRANQLARLLIQHGVQPSNPVGIHMPASVPAIISVIACHKARSAYVPFDPTYPTQRLQYMLDDTRAPVIITNTALDQLQTGACTILQWDNIQTQLDQQPNSNLDLAYTPTDPAYIIYTSGSTGNPKGVVCGHTGVFNLLATFDQWGALQPQTASSLWTSLNFDVSVYELFAPLVSGSTLHIVPADIRIEMDSLFSWLHTNQITSAYLPPFAVAPFADWLQEGHRCPSLHRLLVGVEPLDEQLLVQIQQAIPTLTILNGYGPTEATVCATLYPLPQNSDHTGITPIGKPLLNTQLYLLDNAMQPVPIGVEGELYIGGLGLAHGYLNQPELTAVSFIPNPFSTDPQARLYKTGDLARYLPDGNIMFVGRADFQLKVRGFRIELGEIETHLLALPGVKSTAVTPYTSADGQISLVAYFVTTAEDATNQQQLKDGLASTLPTYMVPAIWIQLDKMPRLPNDKIDRKALPLPNPDALERTTPFVAPRNAIEEQLLAIWQALLNVEKISIHDNFFELGGHSLLATQLVSRIHKKFDIKLPLRDIFNHSTIAQLATVIANSQTSATLPVMTRLDKLAHIPVSFAQQRLLIIDQLAPNQATYNIPLALRIDGPLDVEVLQTAVNHLFQRHDSLRTSFYYENGQPYQKISDATELPIVQIDLSSLPENERTAKMQAALQAEYQRPFSLTTDTLIRITHIQLAPDTHILITVLHHIITDAWSMDIFVRELLHLYTTQLQNIPSQLPPMPIQYTDFSAWQRNWLQGDVLEEQLGYWQTKLKNAPTVVTFPTDLPRPKLQSARGAEYFATLPTMLYRALTNLSQHNSSSLFMTLFTAYNILLARHSQQNDIVIGTPIANRNHADSEKLIGFFVNMLPLRITLSETDTFLDVLAQVRHTALDGYSHQDVPFERVVDALQTPRDTSHTPVFQVVFSLQNGAPSLPDLNGMTLTPITGEATTAKYDLTLAIMETAEGLSCIWEYSTDLFLPETIARLHAHFDTLLHAIVQQPETAVSQLPLLPIHERQQLLHDWQGRSDSTIPQICLHEAIEAWAKRQPTSTAVSDEHTTMTYGELNGRANQLARLLIQHGVQPGDPVGIHMSSSVPAIIAIIACHKARSAYVPFDPAYPTQRLQYMLDDTSAPVILTDSYLADLETGNCTILQWDDIQPQLDQHANTNLDLAYTPADPAYIIYTSGSTGNPKGVVCGHTGVFNLLATFDQWAKLSPNTASALWTSLNFDVSVYEIFAPLVSGGGLHIVPADSRVDMKRLFKWLTSKQIASAYLPPFAVEPFADWLQSGNDCPALQRLLVGVEPLAEQTLVAIQQAIPALQLINGYGPTEATVCTTLYPIPANSTRAGNAPIGRPVLNAQLYVLDSQMQPVPIGVEGELYIGGMGLAHGYLNQPELTAVSFIRNPFSTDPQARLYKTGDLVRYLPDGNIMFIGRADFQLKVRGFRIELGEIESHLLAQEGASSAVVMPHTAADGQITLVAYIVIDPSTSPQQLQDALIQTLPSYMVPSVWIELDALPRLPNDKIDRKALPVPDLETAVRQTTYTPPRTELETSLVTLWQDLLQLTKIGIHDNFFTLGGHSLLAMQMISALSQQLGKEVPLRLVFDFPTIAQLAHQLALLDDAHSWEPIAKRPTDQPIPLSFAQQRLWLIEQMQPERNAAYNIPIHLDVTGELNIEALEVSFNALLARHESLRTRYVLQDDGTPLQEIVPFTAVSLPHTDLTTLPADEQADQAEQLRQENAQTPFNLQTGPIYRIHILRFSHRSHQLLFTVHHIAFDAWSTDLFMQEIIAHYLQQTAGQAIPLPDITVQYADFTLWQQARLTPEVMAEQLAFWRDHLAGAPTALDLPTDKPRPQWQSSHGDIFSFHIPAELAQKVKQWTQAEQVTQYITFLTAFNALLHRYSRQEDVIVGSPIANRNHPDLKQVIGFFLNTLALRSHLEEDTTWRDLLAQTRQTMLAAHAHQEYPFENLVQAILPERDPSRHPLFQVMFVLNNQANTPPAPSNVPIQLSPLGEGTHTAKFDLLLDVQETAVSFDLTLEYNTDLFYPSTISRMAEHFVQLLTALVSEPETAVSHTTLLTEEEAHQLAHWNNTAVSYPDMLVHHHFEAQAAQTPNAIALEFGNQRLTYAELNGRSNQLAHFLQKQGVQTNDLVGILLPRSVEMVTAVLATLKAGAGYVPLDPNYPADRLHMMMAQANIKQVLTHSSVDTTAIRYPHHNIDQLDLVPFGRGNITTESHPDQIAYVIFTSGSTGTPKGVTLPHRALNNLLFWQQDATHNRQPARTLQFTSLSFDVHFQEFFTTWKNGGTLVLIPDDVRRDGEQLLVYIQEHHIERLFLPFVALHNLAEVAQWNNAYPHSLKQVITAGEALQATPAIRRFFSELADCDFFNHYGPSETHVVSQYKLANDPATWRDLPPIGTAVSNTQLHLLDAHMKPVPIGVAGELYIGGANVALGYINQPDLTAERFIADPFADDPTARLYKTGDLARYLPDGSLQYLGRNDFQVKIRGHRVELGEIEAALNAHTAVSQAIVQAHQPDGGILQLVAFVKVDNDEALGDLRPYLRTHLPSYMVPTHFVTLDEFPLTASGKINRRALPMPDKIELSRTAPVAKAETALQKRLVKVWEDVLNVSPIGIHDNFFELGGHSLLALRLISAMFEETAVKVPLPRLFQDGTIAAISAYISNPDESKQTPVVTLRAGNPDLPPLILIHPGSGQVTPYLNLIQALPKDQPIYGLQSLGLLPNTPAQTDIVSMASSYLQALADFGGKRPYHLLGWSMGGVVTIEMAQQLAKAGTPATSVTIIDAFAPTQDDIAPQDGVLLQWFAQDSGYLTPSAKLTLLPDEVGTAAQLRHLWPQLQATGNIPAALTLQDLQQQFDVFRINYTAMRSYKPRPYPHPVQLIIAKASAKSSKSKWLGWEPYLAKKLGQTLRANHFTLLQQPRHLSRIAKTITKTLADSHRDRHSKGKTN